MNSSQPHANDLSSSHSSWADETLVTKSLSLENRSGKKIAAYMDRLSQTNPRGSLIILVPGYGKTKSSHLRLAYYLALNGSQIIRYDHSNHVGDSDGSMLFTT